LGGLEFGHIKWSHVKRKKAPLTTVKFFTNGHSVKSLLRVQLVYWIPVRWMAWATMGPQLGISISNPHLLLPLKSIIG
jgi:hypothetical protein